MNAAMREKFNDGAVRVTIERVPEERPSERLRRYYWSLLKQISDYLATTGVNQSASALHEHYARAFMGKEFMHYEDMTTYRTRGSSVRVSNEKLIEVCQRLQEEWAEVGLYLPDPREKVLGKAPESA